MRKRILAVITCFIMLICVMRVNQIDIKAEELICPVELFVSSEDPISVGQEFELKLSFVNVTDSDCDIVVDSWDGPVENAKIVDILGNEIATGNSVTVPAGTKKELYLTGKISSTASEYDFIYVYATATNEFSSFGCSEGNQIYRFDSAYQTTEENYDIYVDISSEDKIVFGEDATFTIQVYNQSNGHSLTWDSFSYGDAFENVVIKDSNGNIITDNINQKIVSSETYTMTCTMNDDVPFNATYDMVFNFNYANGNELIYEVNSSIYQTNYTSEDWRMEVLDVWAGTKDKVSAGKTVTYEVLVENVCDKSISFAGMTALCVLDEDPITHRLTTEDLVVTLTNEDGDILAEDEKVIEPGETKLFKAALTVPLAYDEQDSIHLEVGVQKEPGMYYTNQWAMFGTRVGDPITTKISKVGAFKAGEKITYTVDMICDRGFTISEIVCDYYSDWNWSESYTLPHTKATATIVDAEGNEWSNNGGGKQFSQGDKITFEYTIDVADDWDTDSLIDMYILGIDEDGDAFKHFLWMDWQEEDNTAPSISMGASDVSLTDAVLDDTEGAVKLDVEVKMTVDDVSIDEASEDVKTKLEEIEDAAGNKVVAVTVDLNVKKKIKGDNTDIPGEQKVTKLHKKIKITIDVPKEYRKSGRKFVVYKEHNGVITELKDLDDNPNTVTFETDEFSLYSIAYDDVSVDENNDTAEDTTTEAGNNITTDTTTENNDVTENDNQDSDSPITSDCMPVMLFILAMFVSVAGVMALLSNRKEY